jgi:hypothetical protein
MSIDEWVTSKRLEQLGMPEDWKHVIRYGPEFMDDYLRAFCSDKAPTIKGYPESLVTRVDACDRKWQEVGKIDSFAKLSEEHAPLLATSAILPEGLADEGAPMDLEDPAIDPTEIVVQRTMQMVRDRKRARDAIAYGEVTGHAEGTDSSVTGGGGGRGVDDSSKGKEEEDGDDDEMVQSHEEEDEEGAAPAAPAADFVVQWSDDEEEAERPAQRQRIDEPQAPLEEEEEMDDNEDGEEDQEGDGGEIIKE